MKDMLNVNSFLPCQQSCSWTFLHPVAPHSRVRFADNLPKEAQLEKSAILEEMSKGHKHSPFLFRED